METLNVNNFQLIRKDFKDLKIILFSENNVNDWDKIIIIYNLYLFFNHLYITYLLMDYISKDKTPSTNYIHQFKNIYIFFFILCNLKNAYAYFIYNVSKIDPKLSLNILNHTKEYFI